LDRYEVCNRPGSGLFFILMPFSYLNFKEIGVGIKGIVSRDWAGLQMGSLDRSDFPTIPLEVYF
jgi:hypothetical protein